MDYIVHGVCKESDKSEQISFVVGGGFFFSLQYANHPKGVICIFTGSSGVSWMFVEYTEDLICFLSKKKKK